MKLKSLLKEKSNLSKEDKSGIVRMSKEMVSQSTLEIKNFGIALKRATINKATAEALIEKFK